MMKMDPELSSLLDEARRGFAEELERARREFDVEIRSVRTELRVFKDTLKRVHEIDALPESERIAALEAVLDELEGPAR